MPKKGQSTKGADGHAHWSKFKDSHLHVLLRPEQLASLVTIRFQKNQDLSQTARDIIDLGLKTYHEKLTAREAADFRYIFDKVKLADDIKRMESVE
jgi:hypothetical protein